MATTKMKRDFLSIADYSGEDLARLLGLAREVKAYPAKYAAALAGQSVAMIFEKQSLRTHVTFDVGLHQLGVHPVYLTPADISLGKRESVYDTAKNLERWVNGVVVRTFAHATCAELAAAMPETPVINALTDHEHPCQALGDMLTLGEHLGDLRGKKLVFVGDGNNVCHSLMLAAAKLGMHFIATTPRGYEPDMAVFRQASAALAGEAAVDINHNPKEALRHADAVYTDVWTSMGQEAEKEERLEKFHEFQVNAKLMAHAKHKALFLHCLPAHRGEEVTDEVIDGAHSVVFDQAENRLHSQKAVLLTLLGGD